MGTILTLDAVELSQKLAKRELSAEQLMSATLERIAEVNPTLNAIVALRSEAELMAEARAADITPRKGWLHGIPIAIKDLVETAGIPSTHGSPLFADHVPTLDDGLVRRLKDAGAIVIGKTNTPEFGLGSHSSNPVYGVTRNPYDPTKTAGGSSGGAAAALAGGMLAVADGSDEMGSLRNPTGWCGVYGFRPTWGTIPADVMGDTFLHTLATHGPMARSPSDLLALLRTMATVEPRRPFGRKLPEFGALDGPIAGMRLGWLGDWGGAYAMEAGVLAHCAAAVGTFESLGCEVIALDPPFDAGELWQSWIDLRSFGKAAGQAATYADAERRGLLKRDMIWEIERGLGLSAMDIQAASEIRSRWYAHAAEMFTQVDCLILPTAQVWPFPAEDYWPWEIAGQKMDTYHRWMEVVVPASLIGLPAAGVPAGLGATGLPMGLQLIGPVGGDARVLNLAQAWHQQTLWSKAPPSI